ncbi:MAG: MATE family efflux transporter [Oleispira sp.]
MTNPLLKMPVKKALITMAAPAAVGMLMTFLFQLVDSYFIGQLGSAELAAISFSYPVYFFLISFFMGTAIAVSAKVGQALGSQNEVKAQGLTSLSLTFFMLLTLALGSLAYAYEAFSINAIFVLLGANTEMLSLIGEYMLPLYIGLFLLLGTLVANSALMAKGVMVKSTLVMALGGLINLVLDYLLIFGFDLNILNYQLQPMGLAGAAWATVISWAVMFMLMFVLLMHQQLFKLSPLMLTSAKAWSEARKWFKEIYSLAVPAIAAQILAPIAIAVVTRFVAMTGGEAGSEAAVAAYGLVVRIESLGLVGILALSVIMTPFIAQNYGSLSNNETAMQRLDQAIAYSGRMVVYWGLIFYGLMLFLIEPLVSLFTNNSEIIEHSKYYFFIVGISMPAFGLLLMTTSFFNGVQQGNQSLRLTLVKSLLLTIPLAVAGFFIADAIGIWLGIAIANIIGAVYAGRLLNNWLIKNDSALVGHKVWQDYLSDLKSLKRFIHF